MPGSILEPTWAQFGAGNAPRTHFHRSGVVFCRSWKDFWSISIGFWCRFSGFRSNFNIYYWTRFHKIARIFRRSKCPSILESTILERSAISQGAENGPINPNNISKNHKKRSPPNYPERPGTNLGVIWRRKRSKDVFSSIWDCFLGRFWKDFGQISIDFWCCFSWFRCNFNIHS